MHLLIFTKFSLSQDHKSGAPGELNSQDRRNDLLGGLMNHCILFVKFCYLYCRQKKHISSHKMHVKMSRDTVKTDTRSELIQKVAIRFLDLSGRLAS